MFMSIYAGKTFLETILQYRSQVSKKFKSLNMIFAITEIIPKKLIRYVFKAKCGNFYSSEKQLKNVNFQKGGNVKLIMYPYKISLSKGRKIIISLPKI